MTGRAPSISDEVERYLRTGEIDPHHTAWPGTGLIERANRAHVVTNDGAVLVDAAAEGIGLAYVFENMVSALVSEKRLVRVLDK